jgi:hypothetical protein
MIARKQVGHAIANTPSMTFKAAALAVCSYWVEGECMQCCMCHVSVICYVILRSHICSLAGLSSLLFYSGHLATTVGPMCQPLSSSLPPGGAGPITSLMLGQSSCYYGSMHAINWYV